MMQQGEMIDKDRRHGLTSALRAYLVKVGFTYNGALIAHSASV